MDKIDVAKLTANCRDAEAHKQRRKLLLRGFSQAAMLEFEDDMSSKIEAMLNGWAAISPRGSFNVYPWLHWLGFDVVCMLCDTVKRPMLMNTQIILCLTKILDLFGKGRPTKSCHISELGDLHSFMYVCEIFVSWATWLIG